MRIYDSISSRSNVFKCSVTNECLGTILKDIHQSIKNDNVFQYATLIKNAYNVNIEDLSAQILQNDNLQETNILRLILAYKIDPELFHTNIEKVNEFSELRKNNGVYYTPRDVTRFMSQNVCYLSMSSYKEGKVEDVFDYINSCSQSTRIEIKKKLLKMTVFDPTCGTGAFIYQAYKTKIDLLKKLQMQITPADILKVLKSLHGNDMDCFSTFIVKIRLLLDSIELLGTNKISKIVEVLDQRYYNVEFVGEHKQINNKFDLIIGNPPYVERTKLEDSSIAKYGNIYGDVLENSFELLKPNGIMSMIIPISYISTIRFSSLRQYIEDNSSYQHIYNFSDRPDCLFAGVHQKLCILVANKSKSKSHTLYTSDYIYWYKSERPHLFKDINLTANEYTKHEFYPKLSNNLETSIYDKITSQNTSLKYLTENNTGDVSVYLNMRATFWIKSFIEEPYKMNEYKQFSLDENTAHLLNLVFNSTLFWWFWIKVSDCWHITNKELNEFKVPDFSLIDFAECKRLSLILNECLEDTKVKVATKQTLYEYKHRMCKSEIDCIDDYLAKAYKLTNEEVKFIKAYQEPYRLSIDTNKK